MATSRWMRTKCSRLVAELLVDQRGVPVRVLGIDPGTQTTGYGVVEHNGHVHRCHLVECGVIRTKRADSLPRKLADIYDGVRELIERHHPSAIAVESTFYGRNVRSALALGQASGIVMLLAEQSEIALALYAPAMVKKTVVGAGRAGKEQVGFMVAQHLRLEHPPTPADAADGVAIALTYVLRR